MEQTHDMVDNFTKLTKEKYDISVKKDSIFNIVPEPDYPYFYILREGIPVDTDKTITTKSGNSGYYSTDKGIVLLAKGRTLVAPNKVMFQQNIGIDPNEKVFVFNPYGTLPDNLISGGDIPSVILSKNEINEQRSDSTSSVKENNDSQFFFCVTLLFSRVVLLYLLPVTDQGFLRS